MSARPYPWVRALIVLLVVAVLAATTYQGVATSLERRRFLRPGALISVGDYQLQIHCTGAGSPTVVLEAAAGSMSPAWALVQPEIAKMARVCSYDRSGLGWSEGDGRYLPERVPADLRRLLEEAKEPGPFILVGHQLGAAFARLVAARDPGQVAALVLVGDPVTGPSGSSRGTNAWIWPWLARIGLVRLTGALNPRDTGLPEEADGAIRAFLNRPDHLTQAAREIGRSTEVIEAARRAQLDSTVMIMSVPGRDDELPAVIGDPDEVGQVIRAIDTMLDRVRTRRAAGEGGP